MSAPLPSHLTIVQSADLLQVSRDTIRRLIASGDLKAYRIGPSTNRRRPIRVDRDSLLALREPVTSLAALKAGEAA
ncbi:helix-turn-helix domain-containing protein [Micrococcus luteus]|uniref:helix-turn-helix domain-containing protein n=1 Tax=Micrococcus TaxID=1269 RepID=UPI00069661C5|nr:MULTISPECIES: helix-turn-helix domain-containing protein [Micrococcus]AYO48901.1 DNA-binding protein [Micrococcus luteus]MBU8794467.1 helix-turn-helix domain-containing protein [Micrococcus luteus]MCM3578762.1 helix-turn-helix domain-containing protein [Micrococcus luteus]MCV7455055.1 helix-turn-helix domain-containing protein [Micrococcus luteus]MCV7472823.1 helix-turn-helix domain-containing protein [Micrococcus luteus]